MLVVLVVLVILVLLTFGPQNSDDRSFICVRGRSFHLHFSDDDVRQTDGRRDGWEEVVSSPLSRFSFLVIIDGR